MTAAKRTAERLAELEAQRAAALAALANRARASADHRAARAELDRLADKLTESR